MNLLDIRTVLFSSIIISAICAIVMNSLWLQNRRRSPELVYWQADFILQFVAILFIALRGILPDVVSMLLGVPLILLGALLMLLGLERYTGKTSTQRYNFILLAVFTLVHGYFTYVQPSLTARNVNQSMGLLTFCSQCAWLLLRRADSEMRPYTKIAGAIFTAYSLISLVRIFVDLSIPHTNDLFKLGLYDTLAVLIYQILLISLTFSLFLMVNRQMFSELEKDIVVRKLADEVLKVSEEKFFKAFQTSPYAITITRAEDGKFIDVNEVFTSITGITHEEALTGTTLGMNIWVNEEDRRNVVALLRAGEAVNGREFLFRKKNGEIITGLFSAQMIQLSGNLCIFSSINDITERKKADEVLKESEARFKAQYKGLPIPTYTWKWTGTEFILMDGNDFAKSYLGRPPVTCTRICQRCWMTSWNVSPKR
jgi:PAS domain S-box-containing protein